MASAMTDIMTGAENTLTLPIGGEARTDGGSTCSSDRYLEGRSLSTTDDSCSADRLDWTVVLSPIERSCIDLTTIEPCVNKAVANLESLKAILAFREMEGLPPLPPPLPPPRKRPSSVRLSRSEAEESDLAVDGVKTGILLDKHKRGPLTRKSSVIANGSAILSSVLNIVARLEHDRQEAQTALELQQAKCQDLKDDLQREDERRHDLLLECIQEEHDRCARDIRELKWHINFEGRKLRRQLEYQKRLTKKNEDLKQEVNYLTEFNPQLEEKIRLEEGKIKDITRMHGETAEDLKVVEQDLEDIQEKCRQIHLVAQGEVDRTEEKRGDLEEILEAAKAGLEETQEESVALSRKVKSLNHKIFSIHKRSKNLDHEIKKSEMHHRLIKERVEGLEGDSRALLQERNQLKEIVEEETRAHNAECLLLEGSYKLKKSAMEKEERDLVKAKRDKESLEHDIDSIKEAIFRTKQKIIDDEKSITRSYRDIERLDKQLEVSLLEYNHCFRNQRRAAEEFKLEKNKAASVEDSLNDSLDQLKKKIKEEKKVQVLYENKSKAQTANMMKLIVAFEQKEERAKTVVTEVEQHVQQKTAKVEELTVVHNEKVVLLQSTQAELSGVEEEITNLEENLGTKKQELTLLQGSLTEEMRVKVNEAETTLERIRVSEAKIEDLNKSIASLEKLQKAAVLSLDQLTVELTELETKLASEQDLEQSWKDEYQEISDFRADADGKHMQYLQDRSKLLQQCKLDFAKSVADNAELARTYYQLQCEFIDVKTRALKVIETKLQLETSLRDHQQLLTFQSCLHSVMADHYHNRGVHSQRDLALFMEEAKENSDHLHSVTDQLEIMLTLLLEFLSKGGQLQA